MFRIMEPYRWTGRAASVSSAIPQPTGNYPAARLPNPILPISGSDSLSLSFSAKSSASKKHSPEKSSKHPLTKEELRLKAAKEVITNMLNAGVPVLGVTTNSLRGVADYQFDTEDPTFKATFAMDEADTGIRSIYIPFASMRDLEHLLPPNFSFYDVQTITNDPNPDDDFGLEEEEEVYIIQQWQAKPSQANKPLYLS